MQAAQHDDDVDLHRARRGRKRRFSEWRLGPGLITGAADDDPTAIGTYSVAGAAYGLQMLWLAVFTVPLMIAVQEMCGRVALVTNCGLAALIRRHFPAWVLYAALVLLVVPNVVNVYADLNAMAATMRLLFGGSLLLWATVLAAAIIAAQVLIPYRQYVNVLKFTCLALLAYVVILFLPQAHVAWRALTRAALTPAWRGDRAFLATMVALLGTTISPYLFFWQASEQVEENIADDVASPKAHRSHRVRQTELVRIRCDTAIGMVSSQVIAAAIMITAAATLHATGHIHISSAQDAAQALRPLGGMAFAIFGLGIVGSGLLAVPTLGGSAAYALAETMGWRRGLFRRFSRARAFYLTIVAVIAAGYLLNFVGTLSPIQALIYAAALNGMAVPPMIVLLLLIANNRKILGKHTNGTLANTVGILTAALITAAAIALWAS
ncbi:MAG TPA: Nramp family divalent metal transporter [Terriglobales bacterium]|nr:Nramp family divalent metal transporter [Terriglobales bacterium]